MQGVQRVQCGHWAHTESWGWGGAGKVVVGGPVLVWQRSDAAAALEKKPNKPNKPGRGKGGGKKKSVEREPGFAFRLGLCLLDCLATQPQV